MATPALVMLAGLIEAVRVGDELDTARWTVPVNRLTEVTLIVVVVRVPAVIVTPVGPAIAKSGGPGGREDA